MKDSNVSGKRTDTPVDTNNMSTVEATLYRSYKVVWLLKFGKCEACLGMYLRDTVDNLYK